MPQVSVPKEPFDAVVVGSGATGGWAVKRLTEAGWRVALLEAGPKITSQRFHRAHAAVADDLPGPIADYFA